jgi:hypothetical protein
MAIHSTPATAKHGASSAAPVVPIDEAAEPLLDEATRHSIERLGEWAHAHAADYGLRLEKIRARRWQSIEDPDWIEVVIDLTVDGANEPSQRFWDRVIDELEALTASQSSPPPVELSTHLHWVYPDRP